MKATTFSQWLDYQMQIRDRSQAWLERELQSGHGTVSHWLAGRRTPSPRNCRRIALILGVDPDEALAAAGHRPPPRPIVETSPEATLIAKVQSIDWLRNEAVYRLVRDMLDNIMQSQHSNEPDSEPVLQLVDIAE